MICIPLRLSPTAFPVESRVHKFQSTRSQWLRAHRDQGRVIVTVPALGCPRVSRWDLTRHRLSSLPYSPDTGGRVGKGATRGEDLIGCGFSLFLAKHLSRQLWRALSTLFYSTAQETVSDSNLWKQFTVKMFFQMLSCWISCFKTMCFLRVLSHQQCDGVFQQLMGKLIRMSAEGCWVQHHWEPSNRTKPERTPHSEAQ